MSRSLRQSSATIGDTCNASNRTTMPSRVTHRPRTRASEQKPKPVIQSGNNTVRSGGADSTSNNQQLTQDDADQAIQNSQSQATVDKSSTKRRSKEGSTLSGNKSRQHEKNIKKNDVLDSKVTASPRSHRTIYSFFNTVTDVQQSQNLSRTEPRASRSPRTTQREKEPVVSEDDLIEDDSFDESVSRGTGEQIPSAISTQKRKAEQDTARALNVSQRGRKFLKGVTGRAIPTGTQQAADISDRHDGRPWVDKYAPTNLEELAVHKKKSSDVFDWLKGAYDGQHRQKLLVLRGAAGTGKTKTVQLVSQKLGLVIREWHNPASADYRSEGFASVASQFDDFLGTSGRYGVLSFASGNDDLEAVQLPGEPQPDGTFVTLIEEFPNTFVRTGAALQNFRSSINRYLAATTPSPDRFFAQPSTATAPPIVMIITETSFAGSTTSADSFTAQRLLGSETLTHPGTCVIDFNPVASTILTKALELVIRKEARDSGRRRAPGPAALKHLSSIGDVRSAVSALEFVCLRADEPSSWSGRVAATAMKGKKGISAQLSNLTDTERKSLEMITQRENTLGIFHAVGKVVYNKREDPAANAEHPQAPPKHLIHFHRPRIPENDANDLFNDLGTDVPTFVATLHENYILSCSDSNSERTQDLMNGCIESLSDADLLASDSIGATRNRHRSFRGNSDGDSLRQEEFSFQAAVRGLQLHLPFPVKRVAPPPGLRKPNSRATKSSLVVGGGSEAAKMYLPTSSKLWRQREEIEGLIDVLLDKAQHGELGRFRLDGNLSNVSKRSFRKSAFQHGSATSPSHSSSTTGSKEQPGEFQEDADGTSYSLLHVGGATAKTEFTLERLPYIGILQRATGALPSNPLLQQIDRVTGVTGQIGQDDEDTSDSEENHTITSPVRVTLAHRVKNNDSSVKDNIHQHQSLVLSDDDIEDD